MGDEIVRTHGEVGFDLTQLLSGQGGYQAYPYRFKHDNSLFCLKHSNIVEDWHLNIAEDWHLISMPEVQRAAWEAIIGENLTLEIIMDQC